MADVSEYWKSMNVTEKSVGRTFERSDGVLACAECCNGVRCDSDCYYRPNCPYCLGTGVNKSGEEG